MLGAMNSVWPIWPTIETWEKKSGLGNTVWRLGDDVIQVPNRYPGDFSPRPQILMRSLYLRSVELSRDAALVTISDGAL